MPVDRARKLVGDDAIVGLSTHSMQQAQAGCRTGADYIAVGPVHATPTKEGRPAIGVEPIKYAAAHVSVPWFAIGGLDAGNVAAVVKAGARRIVVVRAIAQADDPEAAARALRATTSRRPDADRLQDAADGPRPLVGRRSRKRRPGAAPPVAAPPPPRPLRRIDAPRLRARRGAQRRRSRATRAARAGRAPARAGARRSSPPRWAPPTWSLSWRRRRAGRAAQRDRRPRVLRRDVRRRGRPWRALLGRAGFEALLGIIVVFFSLFLLRASNVLAVVVCVPIICGAGWLFWKLIRVMGRLQAPQRVR